LSEDFFTWRHALSGNPISIDLHVSQPSGANAISVDGGNDFDAHASWGEILVTIAMSAVALALVTFFALLIGNA
jgi:hypothetical protein